MIQWQVRIEVECTELMGPRIGRLRTARLPLKLGLPLASRILGTRGALGLARVALANVAVVIAGSAMKVETSDKKTHDGTLSNNLRIKAQQSPACGGWNEKKASATIEKLVDLCLSWPWPQGCS